MDNSVTQKEGIGRTYQGVDGFTCSAPPCMDLALRPGGIKERPETASISEHRSSTWQQLNVQSRKLT